MLGLTVGDYERIHARSERFVVLPGHENPAIEQVVEGTGRHWVVDKFGKAARIVRQADLDA